MAKANVQFTKDNEYYTPKEFVERFGQFDYDPATTAEKAKSAIYRFGVGTGFNERALSGDFVDNDLELIKKVNLTEYFAYISLANIYVYQHKSNGTYHISQTANPAKYTFKENEKDKVRALFYWLYKILVIEHRVTYDNYLTKVNFEQMINYKPSY